MVGVIGNSTDDITQPGIGLHTGMFRIGDQRIYTIAARSAPL